MRKKFLRNWFLWFTSLFHKMNFPWIISTLKVTKFQFKIWVMGKTFPKHILIFSFSLISVIIICSLYLFNPKSSICIYATENWINGPEINWNNFLRFINFSTIYRLYPFSREPKPLETKRPWGRDWTRIHILNNIQFIAL